MGLRLRLRAVWRGLRRGFAGGIRRHKHKSCATCQASNPPLTRSPLLRPQSPPNSSRGYKSLNNPDSPTTPMFFISERKPKPIRATLALLEPKAVKAAVVPAKLRKKPPQPPPLSLPFSSGTFPPLSSSQSRPPSTQIPVGPPYAQGTDDGESILALAVTPRLTPISEISQLSLKQLPLKRSTPAQQPCLTDLPDNARAARSQNACEQDGDTRSARIRRLAQMGRRHSSGAKLQTVVFPQSMSALSSSGSRVSEAHSSQLSSEDSPLLDMNSEMTSNDQPKRATAPPDFTPFNYWGVFACIVSHADWKTTLALRRTSRVMREMVERSFPRELWLHGTDDAVDVGFFEADPDTAMPFVRRRLPFFARDEDDAKGRQAGALWRATSVEISGVSSKTLNGHLRGLSPRASVLVRRLQGTRRNPLLLPEIDSLIIDSFHMRSLRLHTRHEARKLYLVCPNSRFRERAGRRTAQLLNPSVRYLYIEIGGRRTAHAVAVLFDRLKETQLFPHLVYEMGHRGEIIEWERLLRGSLKSWWAGAAQQLRQLSV